MILNMWGDFQICISVPLTLLNIMMLLSPDILQNVLRVTFMKAIELNTKFAVSLALEGITYLQEKAK